MFWIVFGNRETGLEYSQMFKWRCGRGSCHSRSKGRGQSEGVPFRDRGLQLLPGPAVETGYSHLQQVWGREREEDHGYGSLPGGQVKRKEAAVGSQRAACQGKQWTVDIFTSRRSFIFRSSINGNLKTEWSIPILTDSELEFVELGGFWEIPSFPEPPCSVTSDPPVHMAPGPGPMWFAYQGFSGNSADMTTQKVSSSVSDLCTVQTVQRSFWWNRLISPSTIYIFSCELWRHEWIPNHLHCHSVVSVRHPAHGYDAWGRAAWFPEDFPWTVSSVILPVRASFSVSSCQHVFICLWFSGRLK